MNCKRRGKDIILGILCWMEQCTTNLTKRCGKSKQFSTAQVTTMASADPINTKRRSTPMLEQPSKGVRKILIVVAIVGGIGMLYVTTKPPTEPERPFVSEPRHTDYFTQCPNLDHVQVGRNRTATWNTAVDNESYIYSAYYDARTEKRVLVLGFCLAKCPRRWCQMWYKNKMYVVEADFVAHPESHELKFVGSYHYCRVKYGGSPPVAVSLVPSPCEVPKSVINVHQTHTETSHKAAKRGRVNKAGMRDGATAEHSNQSTDQKFRYNYTVCFAPFHSGWNNAKELITAIEMNQVFGADHFIFYDLSPGADVMRVAKHYVSKGLATMLPWKIPKNLTPELLHYYGQVIAINDCIYRSMLNSKYAVITDTDEYITPHQDNNWDEVIQRATTKPFISVWQFRNSFFRLDWKDDPNADPVAKKYNISSLVKLRREEKIFPHGIRSKLILKPKGVIMAGIHFIYKCLEDYHVLKVEPSVALLHHYKRLTGSKDQSPVEDKSMLKFTKQVTQRLVPKLDKLM